MLEEDIRKSPPIFPVDQDNFWFQNSETLTYLFSFTISDWRGVNEECFLFQIASKDLQILLHPLHSTSAARGWKNNDTSPLGKSPGRCGHYNQRVDSFRVLWWNDARRTVWLGSGCRGTEGSRWIMACYWIYAMQTNLQGVS